MAGVDRNLLWSPWSLAMTLAMARDGAAGQTASEMTDVLGAHSDFDARLADGWRRMAHAQGTPLRAANAAWAQSGLEWKQLFRDHLADLSADLKVADFAAGAAGPTDEINRWVADRTAGKVPDLLAPGALTAETRLVLVNALHFKAAWQREFAELGERPFAAPSGSVSAPFLEARGLVGIRYRGWTSAIIPCEGSEFALAVALPDDPSTPLAKVPTIALSLPTAHPEPVGQVAADLTMPAWKLSFAVTLNDQLRTLGMPTAFDPGLADFSAMTAGERLFLGLVVQKATIDVQAKGIEAAAASAVVVAAGDHRLRRQHHHSAWQTDRPRLSADHRAARLDPVERTAGTALPHGKVHWALVDARCLRRHLRRRPGAAQAADVGGRGPRGDFLCWRGGGDDDRRKLL